MQPSHPCIVTADARTAELYKCRHSSAGRIELIPLRSLHNRHEAEHERGRPTLLGRSAPTGPQHTGSPGHTSEEETRRFAREVVTWLRSAKDDLGCSRVIVFSPPRFLGILKPLMDGDTHTYDLRSAGLSALAPTELATHPAVHEALKAHIATVSTR